MSCRRLLCMAPYWILNMLYAEIIYSFSRAHISQGLPFMENQPLITKLVVWNLSTHLSKDKHRILNKLFVWKKYDCCFCLFFSHFTLFDWVSQSDCMILYQYWNHLLIVWWKNFLIPIVSFCRLKDILKV